MSSPSSVDVPESFKCPITLDIMEDPVICEDGYTYERASILSLPTSISPMTRQPINKNKLIPNRNLKDMIVHFKEEREKKVKTTDRIKERSEKELFERIEKYREEQKKQSDKILEEKERLDRAKRQFERFEREEVIKQRQQAEQLRIERKKQAEQQRQAEQLERERIKKERIEKEQVEKEREERERLLEIVREETRLIQIFNSEDNIQPFTIGYAYIQPHPYYGECDDRGCYWNYLWVNRAEQKYMLTPAIIKKIQSCDIGELGHIYKKIVEDTNWIKKYTPLEDRNKAYIDFCFDYIIDKLDEIIAEQQDILERRKKFLDELEKLPAQSPQHSYTVSEIVRIEGTLQNLSSLKVLDKSREYYYENDSIFYSIVGKWIAPRPLDGEVTIINASSHRYPLEIRTHDCQFIKNGKVECYSHWIHHLFINLNSYLTDFVKTFDDCNMVGKFIQGGRDWRNIISEDERKTIQRLQSTHCIESYKEYVQYSMVTAGGGCKDTTSIYRTFIKSDFDPLLKLGDSIIKLIKNLRPDVLLI